MRHLTPPHHETATVTERTMIHHGMIQYDCSESDGLFFIVTKVVTCRTQALVPVPFAPTLRPRGPPRSWE